ncbi:MAG: hypothetical protein ACI9EF_000259 [Pseudohongiellaceae bacterium]|jgi:hypothetical protein
MPRDGCGDSLDKSELNGPRETGIPRAVQIEKIIKDAKFSDSPRLGLTAVLRQSL